MTAMEPPESSSNGPSGQCTSGESSKSSPSKGGGHEGKGGRESYHAKRIRAEREKRKKMGNMFSDLHALLPQLPAKADKTTIVDEAISYIKKLQQIVQQLEKLKEERIRGTTSAEPAAVGMQMEEGVETTTNEAFKADQAKNLAVANSPTAVSFPQYPSSFNTWTSPKVVLNVTGTDAHISIYTAKNPGLFTAVVYVLEKYKLEVLSAHISSNDCTTMLMIQAHASGVSDQSPEMSIEDLYKHAVGEILPLLSS